MQGKVVYPRWMFGQSSDVGEVHVISSLNAPFCSPSSPLNWIKRLRPFIIRNTRLIAWLQILTAKKNYKNNVAIPDFAVSGFVKLMYRLDIFLAFCICSCLEIFQDFEVLHAIVFAAGQSSNHSILIDTLQIYSWNLLIWIMISNNFVQGNNACLFSIK